jgi:alanine-synthesizing transaminase
MAARDFPRIKRLPPYVFNIVGDLKQKARRIGEDIIDFGKVAVSPGIGFGEYGDQCVRSALIENEHRTRQAIRGIRCALGSGGQTDIREVG